MGHRGQERPALINLVVLVFVLVLTGSRLAGKLNELASGLLTERAAAQISHYFTERRMLNIH